MGSRVTVDRVRSALSSICSVSECLALSVVFEVDKEMMWQGEY